jgi:hypothetical protein
MVAWLVLIGALLVPTAGFLLWSWRNSHNDMALMRATETTPAANVAKLPPGSLVEVKGRLRCTSPLTAELSRSPCAHFAATVEREYEVVEYDAKRGTSYRAHKTEIVKSSTLFAPFEIEDASGRALVSPEAAIVEGIAAVDRYDAHEEEGESLMQAALNDGASTDRTLGFRYTEMHLPVDAEIYVLGVVGKDRLARPRPAPRANASSSASNRKRRARQSSAARADGCSASASSSWSVPSSVSPRPIGLRVQVSASKDRATSCKT